jgi:hypothetical protein
MTLLKLPDGETGPSACNDGLGGTADCHDNTIFFSCCSLLTGGSPEGPKGPSIKKSEKSSNTAGASNSRDVKIYLASSNGGSVFYENSTIYIDRSPNADGSFCQSVDTSPHTAPTPVPDGDGK